MNYDWKKTYDSGTRKIENEATVCLWVGQRTRHGTYYEIENSDKTKINNDDDYSNDSEDKVTLPILLQLIP